MLREAGCRASMQKKQLPPTTCKDLTSSKRACAAEDIENDAGPSEGPSKRRRKEGENDHFIGGMRNSANFKAVARLHRVMEAGNAIRRLWTRFIASRPQALEATRS